MMRLKLLKPSHKEKKRYVLYKVHAEKKQNMKQVQDKIISELHTFLGVFQSAQAGIQSVKFDDATQMGIIRVNHKAVDLVRSSFVLMNQFTITTSLVTGVLQKAKNMMR